MAEYTYIEEIYPDWEIPVPMDCVDLRIPIRVAEVAPDYYVVTWSDHKRTRVGYSEAVSIARHMGTTVKNGRQ